MTWSKGKYLSSYTHNGVAYSFTYNVKGERATKTYNSNTCTFCYVDGKLLYENRPNVGTIYYIYDESGVIGFTLNGTQYYYRKNAQGDILSIHSGGGLYATYTYDAWGNCTVTDNSGTGIGDVNPFRYRGYYFDSETGLYYLMTRYYDPEIGRFISADALAYLAPETINGLNLYAYCYNNPVMGYDPNGTFAWLFVVIVAIALVATVHDVVVLTESDNENSVKAEVKEYENGSGVQVANSRRILTPWVQWGYAFYLNHIDENTKDIIQGSTDGVQVEWMLHNIAYYGCSFWQFITGANCTDIIDSAASVDVGKTIFADNHDWSLGMKIPYLITGGVRGIIDLCINGGFIKCEN